MYEIINSENQTSQEVAFLDAGGYTVRSSLEKPKKCSLISSGLQAAQHEAAGRKSFTWNNIKKPRRDGKSQCLHVCVPALEQHWHHHAAVFGWTDQLTWPLDKWYSRCILVLFKPWRDTPESNKHSDGTYRSTLEQFMFHPLFPGAKRGQILRARFNRKVDMGEVSAFVANMAGSQASERKNPHFNNAVQASDLAGSPP